MQPNNKCEMILYRLDHGPTGKVFLGAWSGEPKDGDYTLVARQGIKFLRKSVRKGGFYKDLRHSTKDWTVEVLEVFEKLSQLELRAKEIIVELKAKGVVFYDECRFTKDK